MLRTQVLGELGRPAVPGGPSLFVPPFVGPDVGCNGASSPAKAGHPDSGLQRAPQCIGREVEVVSDEVGTVEVAVDPLLRGGQPPQQFKIGSIDYPALSS